VKDSLIDSQPYEIEERQLLAFIHFLTAKATFYSQFYHTCASAAGRGYTCFEHLRADLVSLSNFASIAHIRLQIIIIIILILLFIENYMKGTLFRLG